MDRKGAEILLDETFNQKFDAGRFQNFIRELFNGFQITPSTRLGSGVYADYIKEYTVLGGCKDPSKHEIEVLSVKLKRASSRDRARTMQRNFIAKHLADSNKDAALVAFHGDDPEDWRFSFVKMEYQLNAGIPDVKTATPVKRYSYLVGTHEPNHTCRSQFVSLLIEDTKNPSLENIEDAFSIEKVTKEFFELYKQRFLELKESIDAVLEKDGEVKADFEQKGISTTDFAKKLLGQIVFIYFLQKKGWLGVGKDAETGKFKEWGTGSKFFLRDLYEKKVVPYDNFFNDILEPLFYEALSTERDKHYYSRFNCKIPFLNGGLFEPMSDYNWQESELLIDNSVFKEILDTFDKFNFTVKEDEPLEKEVAVDPEMLGKVFENLLEVKDRKSKGAFYTPREIVHYMCQQSLINYLETNTKDLGVYRDDVEHFIQFSEFSSSSDQNLLVEFEKLKSNVSVEKTQNLKKLEDKLIEIVEKIDIPKSILNNKNKIDKLLAEIKVVDPAVGSGAFPVGMMNEIVKARSVLSIFLTNSEETNGRTTYDLKRETIENCLYGVDIDSSAVDITKLRFWLSLIVDENDINTIKPLPNLDHKIMCGNSLLEEFEGVKLFDEKMLVKQETPQNYEIELINSKIEELNQQLHDIHTGKIKDFSKLEIVKKEIGKLERKKKELQSSPKQEVQQLALNQLENYKVSQSQNKLRELKKLQKRYFDASNKKIKDDLIKQIDALEWDLIEETLKESGNEASILKLTQYKKTKSKPFFLWKLYFADVFARENSGFDVVIANPPYVGVKGHSDIFEPIRNGPLGKFYSGRGELFYFFFHLSLNLSRDQGSIAFITTNYYPTATYGNLLRKDFKERAEILSLINFNELKIFESALGQHNMITILKKSTDCKIIANTCVTKRNGIANSTLLSTILTCQDRKTDYYSIQQEDLFEGPEAYIRLGGNSSDTNIFNRILNKLSNDLSLGSICFVRQGLRTGIDRTTQSHKQNYGYDGEPGEGVFVITEEELKKININSNERKLIKKFYKNSDIAQYYVENDSNQYVLYLNKTHTEKVLILDFPNIYSHLLNFKDLIIKIRTRNNEQLENWMCLDRPREEYIFTSEKIVAPQRSYKNTFGFTDKDWYASADVYYILQNDKKFSLKYILALVNSKLYYMWLYVRGKRKGNMLELYQKPLSEIPIKEISHDYQQIFIKLVDQILFITGHKGYIDNTDKQAQVQDLQKKIDQLVYQLYELTPEEIEIVENFNSDT